MSRKIQMFHNKILPFTLSIVTILIALFISSTAVAEDRTSFSHLDSAEQGTFNIGLALGGVFASPDKELKRDVLKLDYSASAQSMVGVWTKGYPAGLKAGAVDALKIGVKVPKREQLSQVSLHVEIKGKKDWQKIQLKLKPGWNFFKEPINWNKIGDLDEVVFVVSTLGEKAEGLLYFDLDFYKMTLLQRYITCTKIVSVAVMGIFMALIIALLGIILKRSNTGKLKSDNLNLSELSPLSGFAMDLFYAVIAVITVMVSIGIYSTGAISPLETGFDPGFLVLGLMGLVIAEMLKFAITRKHLTSFEAFQNIILTGLLAASSSALAILEAPSTWDQLLTLNRIVATLAFLVYQVLNARSLFSSGKHLSPIMGILILGTPYIFNWLMLLEDVTMIQTLINNITGGVLAKQPLVLALIARLIVAFVFNEAAVNGLSLAVKGKALRGFKVHLFLCFVSLCLVAAPFIADLGSGKLITKLPEAVRTIIVIITTMLSFAGLWGEVYLITGIILDGGYLIAPSWATISAHVKTGMRKGMAYSGILMSLMYALNALIRAPITKTIAANFSIAMGIIAGALVFPLLKTISETFDGSLPFVQRTRYNYRDFSLYPRGAVVGFGFVYALAHSFIQKSMGERMLFGLIIGIVASAGVSILRDIVYAIKGQGRVQTWRLYFIDALLGGFIGSALAFYMDALQVPVVIEKFKLYVSTNFSSMKYITYPLVSKWGRIDLGSYTGGAKLLFTESLAGVINWSIAAWLFAINKVFMQAYFEKQTSPIKFFFSKAGLAQLIEHMLYVLRWGLWMSPIIFTFLRMMPDSTWYNQDGGIRTFVAIYHNLTMSPEAFRQWSLNLFVLVMAYDVFRVLIWMDHMGLRVATLVNLSFIGLDKLDERIARFIGPATAQRYIPEAVKRFTTWAPLLIPFYLPRGADWDYAWNASETIQKSSGGGIFSTLQSLILPEKIILITLAVVIFTAIFFCIRFVRSRARLKQTKVFKLGNRAYKVFLKENGEVYSEVLHKRSGVYPREFDVSRRSYDTMDPAGRILYLVEGKDGDKKRVWPVIGNFPKDRFEASRITLGEDGLTAVNTANDLKTTIDISLPDKDGTLELWNITIENPTNDARQLKVVPYLEWVLNGGLHDRFHTQYGRLFIEMEYVSELNAILAWQKSTKSMGILAVDIPPEGFLTSRIDFIGRAQSMWEPRALETLNFVEAKDTTPHPTFDPIGSLKVSVTVDPGSSKTIRLMIGYATKRADALEMIRKYLNPQRAGETAPLSEEKKKRLIGHGEILPGTPLPYSEYTDNGNKLLVHTPYTPRPYDHAMSNEAGHSVMVTNRGLHTSCNGNSQQNRLTPDWPDIVTKEVPTEAIYLYDPDEEIWYSPTYHPLNDRTAKYESEFGVDGTAVFRMKQPTLSTELTVFVPPDDPLGVYLLKIRNNTNNARRIRIAPFFEMVLEFQPERSGTLQVRHDKLSSALYFENPRNMFRAGWAFASLSIPAKYAETKRGKFFGRDRGIVHPFMVEKGEPDPTGLNDDRQVASFVATLGIGAQEERTIAIILGQTDERADAVRLVKKYKDIETVQKSLDETRKWWLGFVGRVEVKTNSPEFDWYQNWLKYQTLAERIWARRGYYQTSGAYGFRDQLQDSVNLLWVDPTLARKQIILNAAHQFPEGDVFHWFFTRTDGRTAFSCRSHASDNPVWLAWAVTEYIKVTSDYSILDEKTSYVWSEFPFADLPKNKEGWGHLYHRSTRADSVYRHCMKSIDLVLKKRMGKHGLPLIRTGDWNDGLDEIGSHGKGESVWLGFFLYCILKEMVNIIERKEGARRKEYYVKRMNDLAKALEGTWREDRYLRAYHDDGTEIGVKDSGIWEVDALSAGWVVMADINFERAVTMFNTALRILEREKVILLGWPALRENTKPYLGRSSKYPEGVRENGMYCHGVQWLIKAARILAEQFERQSDAAKADEYRAISYRLWLKVSPLAHTTSPEIENYGGQPNKQAADILTTYSDGRMIWSGYTGAAGWMFRQSLEGVIGASLINNKVILPDDLDKPRGGLRVHQVSRNVK